MALAFEQQVDAVMHQALATHALADARLVERVDRALLQHARADALFDVLAAPGFEDDGIDAAALQQLSEQQAGGAGADDGDLGTHGGCLRKDWNRSASIVGTAVDIGQCNIADNLYRKSI